MFRSRSALLSGTLALTLALAVDASAAPRHTERRKQRGPPELRRRALLITDSNASEVHAIHVAGGVPTTVAFREPIRTDSVLLADPTDAFHPLKATETTIVLLPRRDLRHGQVATLTVTLADGTLLPLLLSTVPHEADLAVDVSVSLVRKASPDSSAAVKATVADLRAELDECHSDSGKAGVAKVARLVLEQDGNAKELFLRQDVHRRDKQERILVELSRAYRLFGHTYLVLSLENRDPSSPWVLDRPEVSAAGDGQSMDLHVVAFDMDAPSLAPGEAGRLVVAFATPAQSLSGGLRLQLLEKNGSRHVRLDGLSL